MKGFFFLLLFEALSGTEQFNDESPAYPIPEEVASDMKFALGDDTEFTLSLWLKGNVCRLKRGQRM